VAPVHEQAWDDYEQLTVTAVADRLERLHGAQEIVSACATPTVERRPYAAVVERARRVASAMMWLGVRRGDHVATLLWNQPEHLELYLATAGMGAVLHTLDPWLPAGTLRAILGAYRLRAIVLDASFMPLLRRIAGDGACGCVVVSGPEASLDGDALEYEEMLAWGAPRPWPAGEPEAPVMLCHVPDATGRPRACWGSQQTLVQQGWSAGRRDLLDVGAGDRVLPAVAMYSPAAWGPVYAALIAGASLVLPGPRLAPESILDLLVAERVTVAAGTLGTCSAIAAELDAAPGRWDLAGLRRLTLAGGPVPPWMADGFAAHGVACVTAA
jgi:fatty-acyl-CoA synthase